MITVNNIFLDTEGKAFRVLWVSPDGTYLYFYDLEKDEVMVDVPEIFVNGGGHYMSNNNVSYNHSGSKLAIGTTSSPYLGIYDTKI